ncbi:TlpA disulfide reductase family protein [Candidatus Planktophila versatilis]|uniref:TlpA disulfide reductase family protein n=1 Tax=Candidatus Planktophila versatilis TaxID=1884905 RepID=UPI000BAC723C|nr:TlpA disulfide reductase family protein [Candidatus Planktophila versatilis]ASY26895.1 thiol-disulfide isomerase [Candidatus Planktophila versatilis]
MTKFITLTILALVLTGCSAIEPIQVKGEVVSCANIKVESGTGVPLECLGGGSAIAADSIRGPALINVWGTWCEPCKQELPHLAHFLAKYSDQVDLVGIAVEEKSMESVSKFVQSHGISWPILYDATGATRGTFGMGVPVTWLVDESGTVVYKKYGPFKSTEEIELAAIKYLGVK